MTDDAAIRDALGIEDRRALSVRRLRDDDGRAPVDATAAVVPAELDDAASLRALPTSREELAGERFRCGPLHVALSALACAGRHDRAKRDARSVGPREKVTIQGSPCLRCAIGVENARRARR